ncbi:transporter substrate-binding domain-containing protein [Paenibacillus agricola]|uniref:Transporter substrate-binding domain-containing protein n=1 Tax=Paenibacillus agricola TaxID=2716264 RepID=A0ABX0JDD2_9BACL|nr:transporter substrate-binding domain-containing protein [Paenibacillus agricola]NHN32743.1 transporter substrate-binding domain-containing protein [Paenibacillus agricola]
MSIKVKQSFRAVMLVSAIALVLASCSTKSTQTPETMPNNTPAGTSANLLDNIKKSGKINIGLMGTYAPYNFLNDKHEVDGFDADVAKEVAKRMGVEVEFITGEFSGLIEGLQKDKYDALVSQVTITEDRKKTMDFSTPYIKNSVNVIVQEGNTTIQSVEDFKSKKIGVGLGTNDEKYLRETLIPKVGDFEIVTYNDVITSLTDLNIGRIDATINNMFAITPLVEKNQIKIKAVGEAIKDDFAGIAIRKNNPELLGAVNNALDEMKSDGTFKEIFQKWFGVDPNI